MSNAVVTQLGMIIDKELPELKTLFDNWITAEKEKQPKRIINLYENLIKIKIKTIAYQHGQNYADELLNKFCQ